MIDFTLREIKEIVEGIEADGFLLSKDILLERLEEAEELKANKIEMSLKQNDEYAENYQEKREAFLAEHDRKEGDVITDNEGDEYIIIESDEEVEDESGTPQATGKLIRKYLPTNLLK